MELLQRQLAGLPAWGWACLVSLFLIESAMGRARNPQLRALGLAVASLTAQVARPTLGRVPGVGPVVVRVLDTLAPQPGPPCSTCGGTGQIRPGGG